MRSAPNFPPALHLAWHTPRAPVHGPPLTRPREGVSVPDLHVETAVCCRAKTSTTTTPGRGPPGTSGGPGTGHADPHPGRASTIPASTPTDHHHPPEMFPGIDRSACLPLHARRGSKPLGRRPFVLTAAAKHLTSPSREHHDHRHQGRTARINAQRHRAQRRPRQRPAQRRRAQPRPRQRRRAQPQCR